MDDRASESFVFEGCMNESLYIQENGNFNCRQCEIIVDVDHTALKRIFPILPFAYFTACSLSNPSDDNLFKWC